MVTLSKSAEIEILAQTANRLGAGYSGAWLRDQLPYISDAIRSDLDPSTRALTMAEANQRASECIQSAAIDARKIRDDARDEAARVVDKAIKQRDRILCGLVSELKKILSEIQ
jgi:cell division septum initiation protein DivIVA